MRCHSLVGINVLLHAFFCSVQSRFKAVLRCFRYVDTVAIGTPCVSSSRYAQKKKQVQKQVKKRESIQWGTKEEW